MLRTPQGNGCGFGVLISSMRASTGEIIADIKGHHESTGCCAHKLQRKLVQPRKCSSEEVIFKLKEKYQPVKGKGWKKYYKKKYMCESTKAEQNLMNLSNWKKMKVAIGRKTGQGRGGWVATRSCEASGAMWMNLDIVWRVWGAFEKFNIGCYVYRQNRDAKRPINKQV